MKKIGLLLSLLICSILIFGCNNQENFSQEISKESVAILLGNDESLISPIINSKTNNVENVLSVLSEDQIDIALQIISENLAKTSFSDGERPDWTYQDYYDLALTQYRSIRNVALELFKKDLNELSVEEYLDILDNHLSDLYENAVSIAPSEKIKNAVWGGNSFDYIDEPIVEEPTYEILEWTGYMGCIGGCEDGSDEEYVEGYYYRYTNPELGLRITTPSGDGGNYNEGFRIKRETPIFKLVDNTIYSLEYDYASNWSISDAEFIKVYDKDPTISLENLLKEQYQNCKINKVESNNLKNFHGFGAYFYDIESDRGLWEDNCIAREEGEGGSLVFYIESKDDNKYYKVGVNDGCAPGPCTIFGKVETL